VVAFGNLWCSISSRVLSGFVIVGFSRVQEGRLNLSRPEFTSLAVIGEQNPTHLYKQAHDRVGNHCGQEGENHLCATFCSFMLGRVSFKKGNCCPGERNQQANEGVEQADKGGNDGDDYVGTRLAPLL
jgi:capsid protein